MCSCSMVVSCMRTACVAGGLGSILGFSVASTDFGDDRNAAVDFRSAVGFCLVVFDAATEAGLFPSRTLRNDGGDTGRQELLGRSIVLLAIEGSFGTVPSRSLFRRRLFVGWSES